MKKLKLKHFSLLTLLLLTLFSCNKDELSLDGTYAHASSILVDWETYKYDADGNYQQIPNDEAPTPDISYYEENGFQLSFTFKADGKVEIVDGVEKYESTFEGENPVTIDVNGQPTAYDLEDGGRALTGRGIASGNFNPSSSPDNIWVSSTCGDFVNCEEIVASEWLFTEQAAEGEILYIVVVEESYMLQ